MRASISARSAANTGSPAARAATLQFRERENVPLPHVEHTRVREITTRFNERLGSQQCEFRVVRSGGRTLMEVHGDTIHEMILGRACSIAKRITNGMAD